MRLFRSTSPPPPNDIDMLVMSHFSVDSMHDFFSTAFLISCSSLVFIGSQISLFHSISTRCRLWTLILSFRFQIYIHTKLPLQSACLQMAILAMSSRQPDRRSWIRIHTRLRWGRLGMIPVYFLHLPPLVFHSPSSLPLLPWRFLLNVYFKHVDMI